MHPHFLTEHVTNPSNPVSRVVHKLFFFPQVSALLQGILGLQKSSSFKVLLLLLKMSQSPLLGWSWHAKGLSFSVILLSINL